MMKEISILIIIGFIGIAVFGFFGMGEHGPEHNFGGCIAALRGEADCSVFKGLLDFASFHLGAFKTFSSANLSIAAAIMALLAGFALLFAWFRKNAPESDFYKKILIPVLAYSFDYGLRTSHESKMTSWFALHEKRDAASLL